MDKKPSRPKPCAKIMHKTIGRSTEPNIGSKKQKKIVRYPKPHRGGLLSPLKTPVTAPLRNWHVEGGAPPPPLTPPVNYVG